MGDESNAACERIDRAVIQSMQEHENAGVESVHILLGLAVAIGRMGGAAIVCGIPRPAIHGLFENMIPIMVTQADFAISVFKAVEQNGR